MNKEKQIEYLMDYQESLRINLKYRLRETRQEPGLPIREIAKICKGVFAPCEIKILIKELK